MEVRPEKRRTKTNQTTNHFPSSGPFPGPSRQGLGLTTELLKTIRDHWTAIESGSHPRFTSNL